MRARRFLILALWMGLIPSHAQVLPILECVDTIEGSNFLVGHFGYFNTAPAPLTFQAGSAANFFVPLPANRFQQSVFQPGMHHYALSLLFPAGTDLIWLINNQAAVARNDPALRCHDPNTNLFIAVAPVTQVPMSAAVRRVPLGTVTAGSIPQPGATPSLDSIFFFPGPDVPITNLVNSNGVILGDIGPSATPAAKPYTLTATSGTGVARAALMIGSGSCSTGLLPVSLSPGAPQQSYGPITLAGYGGTPPYRFDLGAGALPPGLTLQGSTLTGTILAPGAYSFDIAVRDSTGCVAVQSFSINAPSVTCAANVASRINLAYGAVSRGGGTGPFTQSVTVRNAGPTALDGPIALVLDNLSANAALYNPEGRTGCAAPSGSPYVIASTTALAPASFVTVPLQFTNSNPDQPITYTVRVLSGGSAR